MSGVAALAAEQRGLTSQVPPIAGNAIATAVPGAVDAFVPVLMATSETSRWSLRPPAVGALELGRDALEALRARAVMRSTCHASGAGCGL